MKDSRGAGWVHGSVHCLSDPTGRSRHGLLSPVPLRGTQLSFPLGEALPPRTEGRQESRPMVEVSAEATAWLLWLAVALVA